jgi:cytochrome c-type biogenesis protein CcmH/NrfG
VSRPPRARLVAYLAAGAVAVLAAVLLPTYVSNRPAGGAVTVNEVLAPNITGTQPATPDLPDMSAMSDADLAAAVDANPTAIGMRLALAERYVAAGAYDKATDHYTVALQQDPENPEALAGAGWLLFRTGKTADGLRLVDQALLIAPDSANALWYKANILLDGWQDTTGALTLLRQLADRDDLPADLRTQVDELITTAEWAGDK